MLHQIYASSGESEVPGFFEGARSRDLIEPLSEEEEQHCRPLPWLKWSGSAPCDVSQMLPLLTPCCMLCNTNY